MGDVLNTIQALNVDLVMLNLPHKDNDLLGSQAHDTTIEAG